MNDNEKAAANFICGYLRGLWNRIGEKPEPMVVAALKRLRVPAQFLPEIEDKPTPQQEAAT